MSFSILIRITGNVVGRTWFYEEPKRQGKKRIVPTYAAQIVTPDDLPWYEFAVTRDVTSQIFGSRDNRFGHLGECPPSPIGRPYFGRIRDDVEVGYAVQLFSESDPLQEEINGPEGVRKHIMIHRGPSTSWGCMSVAGGKLGFARFREKVDELSPNARAAIHVHVLPRELSV